MTQTMTTLQTMKTAKNTSTSKKPKGFTAEEHAAMKEYVQELRADKNDESSVLAKIDEMKEPDRSIAKRVHAVIKATAPALTSRLWYGMPAYAKDDKVVCFFQPALKFKSRYATLGFSDKANLDDGTIWPVVYAVKQLTAAEETKISSLVKKAVS
ncbi:MAG TPA: DUF1801 domain-containing protein [Candidatus Dormibacteraeota bacterium]|nr:DUF1801 domain-containing protein [Candidatus Dormibacteraeota bacterium]